MKRLAISVVLILFGISSAVAQSAPKKQTIEQLINALSDAYMAKDLGRLDATRPYLGKVKIVIEHSLLEGTDQYEVKWVRTLAMGERWLRSREEEDGTPLRGDKPLLQCKRGLCRYDLDGGISHNHLYLKRIRYGYRNGRPYIRTIYLLDGD